MMQGIVDQNCEAGELRLIDINESDTEPLVGMSLLYGYLLQLDVIEEGMIKIQALSSLS